MVLLKNHCSSGESFIASTLILVFMLFLYHIYTFCARLQGNLNIEIPGINVIGQTDVTGAGDMFSASFISAFAGGATLEQAGEIGNIAASICVRQIGTSGHITTKDIMRHART